MNRFKILKLLNLTTFCILMSSVNILAAKNEPGKNNIQKLPESEKSVKYSGEKVTEIEGEKMPITNIGGFNFKQVAKNIQDGALFFRDDRKFNLATIINEKKSNNSSKNNYDLKILFTIPIKNAQGNPHAIEHFLANYLRDISGVEDNSWFSAYAGMVAPILKGKTGKNINGDLKNCRVELIFKDEFFKDEKRWEALGKTLLGDLFKDKNKFKEYYDGEVYGKYKNKETSRMIAEIEGKENSKDPMEKIESDVNKRFLVKGMYKYWGDINELKDTKIEDLKKFYEKYFVDAKPLIILNCRTKEEVDRKISLLNRYYLKNKKKFEVTKDGVLAFEPESYIERKATDLELSEFSYVTNGNERKNKEINHISRINFFDTNKLNEIDNVVLNCLKEEYVKDIVDYKNLGVDDFFITTGDEGLQIQIKGNKNKKFSFSEKELLKIAKEVKEKLLEKIKNKGIKKEDLDGHILGSCARAYADRNIDYEEMIKKMDYSSRKYKTPFSEKYFLVDKNNNLMKDMPKMMAFVEDYFIKNCERILKDVLENEPKIENIVKPEGKNNKENIKEVEKYEPERTKLPFKYNLSVKEDKFKNNLNVKLAEEAIYEKILHPIVNKGLLYKYPEGRNIIENYPEMVELSETEKRNLGLYFKEDFKKDLEKLEKDFSDDRYLNKLKERYTKVIENQKQKITDEKKVQEKGIKALEEIKSKLNEKIKDETNIIFVMDEIQKNSVNINIFNIIENIKKLVFLTKKENENCEKILDNNEKKNKFKINKCPICPNNKDVKEIKNNIKKLIDLEINNLKDFINFEEIIIDKMGKYQKESKDVKSKDILNILKGIVVDDFYKVNNKKEKNKDENKKSQKKD